MPVTHTPGHRHAFVRDGEVITVAVFEGHDTPLLNTIAASLQAEPVCCCDHGIANTGDLWDGTTFTPADPPVFDPTPPA